ncbi:hypothetical protein DDZ13_08175 [Coraliomargarita sinensis]|uniref:Uncharacterized protein n=1 Tax=Coraliomargarita sinensis TaxID=2174842 RepID=A0A317ZGI6_9BACT|nr:hypothetical protein DDZ13_08175 [Coraliomargarita sinensis]
MKSSETFTMRLPKEELDRIDNLSDQLDVSRSRLFRRLSELALDALEDEAVSWPIRGMMIYRAEK